MANYYKNTHSLSLAALSEEAVALQRLNSLPAAVPSIDSSVGMQGVCICLHVCVCACVSTYSAGGCIHVPACPFAMLESHWTRALRELLVPAIVVKVVERSDAFHSCLWNGSSLQCLSVRSALPRACSRLLISFNKHQIPRQVSLCTCEADEVCLLARGREVGIKEKISYVITTIFKVHSFVLFNVCPHMYLRGFVLIHCVQTKSPNGPVTEFRYIFDHLSHLTWFPECM